MYPSPTFSDPQINNGKPVFSGTRISVEFLFDHLRIGCSINDFLRDYPSVTRDQVMEVLRAQPIELNKMNLGSTLIARASSAS